MPALDLEEDNNTTTRLLTLLNVSALRSSKRKGTDSIETTPRVVLNKRRSVQLDAADPTPALPKKDEGKPEAPPAAGTGGTVAVVEDMENDQGACDPPNNSASPDVISGQEQDPYEEHFGAQSCHLSPTSQGSTDRGCWRTSRSNWRALGSVIEFVPESSNPPGPSTNGNPVAVRVFAKRLSLRSSSTFTQVLPRLKIQFECAQEGLAQSTYVGIPTIVSC